MSIRKQIVTAFFALTFSVSGFAQEDAASASNEVEEITVTG